MPSAEPIVDLAPFGQVRVRGEAVAGRYDYVGGTPTNGDDTRFVASRVRAGLTAQRDFLTLHASIQDVRRFGEAPPGANDGILFGLQEGYLHVDGDVGWLRLGRQAVAFGDQRLVGALDWSMAGRSFDALRLHGAFDPITVDVVGAIVRMRRAVEDDLGNQVRSNGDQLVGIYSGWHPREAVTLEPYVLYRHDGATESDLLRSRWVISPGLRVHGRPHPRVGYALETTYQRGQLRDSAQLERDHRAVAVTADVTGDLTPVGDVRVSGGGVFLPGAGAERLGHPDPLHFSYLWIATELK